MASQASKIKVKNPVVELDGDEVRTSFFLSEIYFRDWDIFIFDKE